VGAFGAFKGLNAEASPGPQQIGQSAGPAGAGRPRPRKKAATRFGALEKNGTASGPPGRGKCGGRATRPRPHSGAGGASPPVRAFIGTIARFARGGLLAPNWGLVREGGGRGDRGGNGLRFSGQGPGVPVGLRQAQQRGIRPSFGAGGDVSRPPLTGLPWVGPFGPVPVSQRRRGGAPGGGRSEGAAQDRPCAQSPAVGGGEGAEGGAGGAGGDGRARGGGGTGDDNSAPSRLAQADNARLQRQTGGRGLRGPQGSLRGDAGQGGTGGGGGGASL